MNSCHSLWEATYPPYLQAFFLFQILKTYFSFSLTWDPMGAKISKRYFSHSYYPISTKLYGNHGNPGDTGFYILAINPIWKKKYGTLIFFLNTGHYVGLEFSKHYVSYRFQPISAKLCEDVVYHGELQIIIFLGNRSSFETFVALGILTWETMGKS